MSPIAFTFKKCSYLFFFFVVVLCPQSPTNLYLLLTIFFCCLRGATSITIRFLDVQNMRKRVRSTLYIISSFFFLKARGNVHTIWFYSMTTLFLRYGHVQNMRKRFYGLPCILFPLSSFEKNEGMYIQSGFIQ